MPAPAYEALEITEMPERRMIVVHDRGDPGETASRALPVLYTTAVLIEKELAEAGQEFHLGAPTARWPDAHLRPKDQWEAHWALEVPRSVDAIPEDSGAVLETWESGPVAQVVHHGSYETEMESVAVLQDFIATQGYEPAGPHEEEYLTPPGIPDQRTVIRYRIQKR